MAITMKLLLLAGGLESGFCLYRYGIVDLASASFARSSFQSACMRYISKSTADARSYCLKYLISAISTDELTHFTHDTKYTKTRLSHLCRRAALPCD